MTMRRFRRSFRRRTRRRTRWLSIIPGSRLALPNNTFAVDGLNLQDKGGTVNWSEFYGGTLLRVILDVQKQYNIGAAPLDGDQQLYFGHAGIFLTPDNSPDAVIWDPNVPSGDFMERLTAGEERVFWNGFGIDSRGGESNAFVFHFDTNVRRRIRENDQLFISWRHFFSGPVYDQHNYGWTGRVLIGLP